MVKHKKIKIEPEGNSKPILESSSGDANLSFIDVVATELTVGDGEYSLPVADETTKPFMQSDQDLLREAQATITDLTRLINECPKPEFYKIEDALGYQDKWDKWHSKVLTQWQKI